MPLFIRRPAGAPLGQKIFVMKNHLGGDRPAPSPSNELFNAEEKPDVMTGSGSRPPLPEGWRRLSTGLRGSRLYCVTRPGGTMTYWEAEMSLDSGRVQRRFASELHARALLHLAAQPRFTQGPA